jgi:hypothetical protein
LQQGGGLGQAKRLSSQFVGADQGDVHASEHLARPAARRCGPVRSMLRDGLDGTPSPAALPCRQACAGPGLFAAHLSRLARAPGLFWIAITILIFISKICLVRRLYVSVLVRCLRNQTVRRSQRCIVARLASGPVTVAASEMLVECRRTTQRIFL